MENGLCEGKWLKFAHWGTLNGSEFEHLRADIRGRHKHETDPLEPAELLPSHEVTPSGENNTQHDKEEGDVHVSGDD